MADAMDSPGWYPNPDGPGERWWNGVGWSDARRGAGAVASQPAPPRAVSPQVVPPPVAPTPVIYSAANPAPQQPGVYAPGTAAYTPRAAMTINAQQNPMSVYALVTGILAFFFNVLLIPSILAIVFGARALKRSNELRASGQEDRTRGLAVAGIVLGIVGGVWGLIQGLIILVGFLPIFFIDVS